MNALPWMAVAVVFGVVGCAVPDREKDKADLLETDRAFSRLSVERGMAEAFYQYMADSGVALPRSGRPRTRAFYDSRRKLQQTGSGTLSWEPVLADVGAAGDLGYTHGKYLFEFTDSTGTTRQRGHYMTVWKKQPDGSWRFVMDAGNENPEGDSLQH